MTTRLILDYRAKNSHAFTFAEPWTRLLVEVEASSDKGHLVGGCLSVRKPLNDFGTVDSIQVELLSTNTQAAQRCLDACAWWLRKDPFSVNRLPVRLIAHQFTDSLVSLDGGWRVARVDVSSASRNAPQPIDFADLRAVLPDVVEVDVAMKGFWTVHRSLHNLNELQACQRLHTLDISKTDVTDLAWIPLLQLRSLTAAFCKSVRTITPLLHAPRLRAVCFAWTPVRDLSLLGECPMLEEVDLTHCSFLTDISFCAKLRALKQLSLCETDIADLSPLTGLHLLHSIYLKRCMAIADLSPLSSLPALRVLIAAATETAVLGDLRLCWLLARVDLSSCARVHDLRGLTGSPQLHTLDLVGSGLKSLQDITSCPALTHLNVSHCRDIQDLSPLANMTSLVMLDLSQTPVSDLTPLGSCPRLAQLTLNGCRLLRTLSPLRTARSLTTLSAEDSGLTTTEGLRECVSLKVLCVRQCWKVRDISDLAGAPSLTCIDASQTMVEVIPDLSGCLRLKKLILSSTPASEAHDRQRAPSVTYELEL